MSSTVLLTDVKSVATSLSHSGRGPSCPAVEACARGCDVAASSQFKGSTSGQAVCVSQRHSRTWTHTGHRHGQSHRSGYGLKRRVPTYHHCSRTHFEHDHPALYLFVSGSSVPPCFPSPACPSLGGTVPPTPSNIVDPQVCIPISCKVQFYLQVLASPSIAVTDCPDDTDQIYFWLFCLLTLIAQISGICVFVSLLFLILLTDKISIPVPTHPYQGAQLITFVLVLLSPVMRQSGLSCSCLWLLWPDTLKGEASHLPYTLLRDQTCYAAEELAV